MDVNLDLELTTLGQKEVQRWAYKEVKLCSEVGLYHRKGALAQRLACSFDVGPILSL